MSLLPPAITPSAIGWAVQQSLNHTRLDLGSGRCFAVRIKIRVGGNSLVRWLSLGSYGSIGSSKLSAHCPWHDFEQIRQRHLDRDFQTDHGLSSYPLYDRDTLFYTSGIIEVIYPLFFTYGSSPVLVFDSSSGVRLFSTYSMGSSCLRSIIPMLTGRLLLEARTPGQMLWCERHGLGKCRNKYRARFPDDWPPSVSTGEAFAILEEKSGRGYHVQRGGLVSHRSARPCPHPIPPTSIQCYNREHPSSPLSYPIRGFHQPDIGQFCLLRLSGQQLSSMLVLSVPVCLAYAFSLSIYLQRSLVLPSLRIMVISSTIAVISNPTGY